MKIEYVKGDIFQSDHRFILHGCNARGVMNAGFAKLVRDKHPFAYDNYMAAYKSRGLKLGEIIIVRCKGRVIVHAITQQNYGRDNIRYVSYDAIAAAMAAVEEHLYGNSIAMPMIGCGLGGGDWNVISSIIESELKSVKPYVYQL